MPVATGAEPYIERRNKEIDNAKTELEVLKIIAKMINYSL